MISRSNSVDIRSSEDLFIGEGHRVMARNQPPAPRSLGLGYEPLPRHVQIR